QLLGRLFAGLRLPVGTPAPENFSLVLPSRTDASGGNGGATRGLDLLLASTRTVVRSRSPRRVVWALAAHLSALLEPDGDLVYASGVGALVGGEAVILPRVVRDWLEHLQPRLARLGVSLSDEPVTAVDWRREELVVPEPRLGPDPAVMATLPDPGPSRSELAPVGPGRYPLRAWAVTRAPPTAGAPSLAWATALLLSDVLGGSGEVAGAAAGELVDRLAEMAAGGVRVLPLACHGPDELLEAVASRLLPGL
ncbi:MAG: hypothetical protein ACRDZQ_05460, partial [Acidimicrobiales bacterium]